jgi:hypothetical protein
VRRFNNAGRRPPCRFQRGGQAAPGQPDYKNNKAAGHWEEFYPMEKPAHGQNIRYGWRIKLLEQTTALIPVGAEPPTLSERFYGRRGAGILPFGQAAQEMPRA